MTWHHGNFVADYDVDAAGKIIHLCAQLQASMADHYALVSSQHHPSHEDEEPFLPEEERTTSPRKGPNANTSPGWSNWLTIGLSLISLLSTLLLQASFPTIEELDLSNPRNLASLRTLAPYPNLETLETIKKQSPAKGSTCQVLQCAI